MRRIEAVVIGYRQLACPVLDHADHAEGGQIRHHVDEHVVHERGHAESRPADHAEHDVASLRDRRIGQKTLEILLADREQVRQRDRHDDHAVENALPLRGDRSEHLDENRHQHEHGRSLGYDREIGRNRRRGAFVDIRRPLMERHERNLEEQPYGEEHERHDLERRTGNGRRNVVEIERSDRTVQQRHAVKRQARSEYRVQDILGSRLGRLVPVLVERDERRHRDRGRLQTDEEEQEVSRRDHEIHAQQRGQRQEIELAPLMNGRLAREPSAGLHQHDQRSDVQNTLDHAHHRRVLVHAAERFARSAGNEIQQRMDTHQHAGYRLKIAQSLLRGAQVV